MKKVIMTIALMVVVLFLPSVSEASWELVYEHHNGIRVYVDSATCRTIEGGLEVRTRRVRWIHTYIVHAIRLGY